MSENPLWAAIKLQKRAERSRAHPRIQEMLNRRVSEAAAKLLAVIGPDWQTRLTKGPT